MTCGTCGHWGRPARAGSFGFCFAKKIERPIWMTELYPIESPVTGRTAWKVLDQSPLMPFTDGQGCGAAKARTPR